MPHADLPPLGAAPVMPPPSVVGSQRATPDPDARPSLEVRFLAEPQDEGAPQEYQAQDEGAPQEYQAQDEGAPQEEPKSSPPDLGAAVQTSPQLGAAAPLLVASTAPWWARPVVAWLGTSGVAVVGLLVGYVAGSPLGQRALGHEPVPALSRPDVAEVVREELTRYRREEAAAQAREREAHAREHQALDAAQTRELEGLRQELGLMRQELGLLRVERRR